MAQSLKAFIMSGQITTPANPAVEEQKFDLLTENPVYKPFRYPWAYDAWLTQQRVHWLPEEVPLADDVKDWHKNLTPSEHNLLTQIFRFFTQADVEVNNCYMKQYSQVFKPTEVLMIGLLEHRDDPHRCLFASSGYRRDARSRIYRLPQIQRDEGQIRFHARLLSR